MQIKTIELRELKADDGMVLTNGEVFSDKIYLGCNDKPENWDEVTQENAKIMQEQLESELQEV